MSKDIFSVSLAVMCSIEKNKKTKIRYGVVFFDMTIYYSRLTFIP